MLMDVHQRGNLRFPQSLPEFQRLFPDDAACAGYLEKARWSDGFVCPHCQAAGEPFRFANRPGVLRCRKCRRDTGLTVGTVMARSHTPLSVWFWSAYLVSSQTPGMSAVQLRRQLGLSRGSTLHVVGVGNNRIGKLQFCRCAAVHRYACSLLSRRWDRRTYPQSADVPGYWESSARVGNRPFGVNLSTTPGRTCDNCRSSSSSDKPDCSASVLRMFGPSAFPT